MKATAILKDEHRVIEQVLTCLERMSEQAGREARLPVQAARDALDFFRGFADHCHHAKEETRLFPLLESKGFSPECGPTAVMRHEHEQGRAHIRAMDEAIEAAGLGDPAAVKQFTHHARAYIELLRNHISKEDHCLFAMADEALSREEDDTLTAAFEHVEHHEIGQGCHEAYLRKADSLASAFGVPSVGGSLRDPRPCAHGACSDDS